MRRVSNGTLPGRGVQIEEQTFAGGRRARQIRSSSSAPKLAETCVNQGSRADELVIDAGGLMMMG